MHSLCGGIEADARSNIEREHSISSLKNIEKVILKESMKRTYTKEELQALHRELYDILRETIRVCEEHDIRYFLIGGTAIGALYDQAILPWDG